MIDDGEQIEQVAEAVEDVVEEQPDEIVSVQIGDEEPEQAEPEAAPEWVRDLRKQNRTGQAHQGIGSCD